MSDSVPWPVADLGGLADVNPVTLGAKTPPHERFRYIDLGAVNRGSIAWDDVIETDFAHAPSRARRVVSEGDVLFGTVRPALRSHGYIDKGDNGRLVASTGFAVIRARPPVVPRFLFHVVLSNETLAQTRRNEVGSNYPAVNESDVHRLVVPNPHPGEQQKIADVLDTVDAAVRSTERLIAKLARMRRGLLHDLVGSSLSAPEAHDGSPTLADVVARGDMQLGRGKVISALDIDRFPGPYPIYSSSASGMGEFGRYGKFMFDEELITWSVDGGGRPFLRPAHRFSVTNVGGFLRIRAADAWDYRYVYALMSYQHARLRFDWQLKAHPSVIRDVYKLPERPLGEQRRISDVLDAADAGIRGEVVYLEKLRLLRIGLMDDLLTGGVRVTGDNEDMYEPAVAN